MARTLKDIGERGLVVHEGSEKEGTYRYFNDNKAETWRAFKVSETAAAKARGFDTKKLQTLIEASVPVAVLPGSGKSKGRTFLVNLDAYGLLEEPSGKPESRAKVPAQGDAFLIHEKQNFYLLLSSEMKDDLQADNAGEAKVLVRRGTIAAAIPHATVPYGTNCALINLTQLLPKEYGEKQEAKPPPKPQPAAASRRRTQK